MNASLVLYLIEQATLRAWLLCATAGFPRDEVEDARQDLLLDFLRRAPKFDRGRGDWSGFVRGLMRNQAAVLIYRRNRRIRREVFAGNLIEPGSDTPEGVLEGMVGEDPTASLEVSVDVQRVLLQLPHHLQNLACLLSGMPIHDVCTATGKSRSRVYQMIRQLRGAFSDAGFGRRRRCR